MTPERGRATKYLKLDKKKCRKRIVEYGTFYPKVSQGSLIRTESRVKRLYGAGYEFYKPTVLLNFPDKSKRTEKNSVMEKFKYASLVIWLKLVIKK